MFWKFCKIILIFFIGSLLAQSPEAARITLHCADSPLESVLKMIQSQADIRFIYDADLIQNKKVSCFFQNLPLDSALTTILKGSHVGFQLFPPNSFVFYQATENKRTLTGVVVDQQNREGLSHANILLNQVRRGTATNESGEFQLENVTTQLCTLMVCYIGYEPFELAVAPNQTAPLQIELNQRTLLIDSVIVESARIIPMFRLNPDNGISINSPQLKLLPTILPGDLWHSLQQFPGSKKIYDQSDGLFIHGGTPDQNQVLLNGIPVFRTEHLWGFLNVFHPEGINQITVHNTGFPVRFGNSLSSVIELERQSDENGKFKIESGADFLSANGFAQIPVNSRLHAAFSFRHSFPHLAFSKSSAQMQDHLFLIKRRYRTELEHEKMFKFYDAIGCVKYTIAAEQRLRLTLFTSFDQINLNPPEAGTHERFEKWLNQGVGLDWQKKWGKDKQTKIKLSRVVHRNDYYYDYHLFGEFWGFQPEATLTRLQYNLPLKEFDRFELTQINLKAEHDFKSLSAGLEIIQTEVTHWLPENHLISYQIPDSGKSYQMIVDLPPVFTATQAAFYLEKPFKIYDSLEFTFGLRGTYYEPQTQIYSDPRISCTFRRTPFVLDYKWGRYHQFIHRMPVRAGDFNPIRTSYFWALADDQRPPAFAEHHIFGLSQDWPGWRLGMSFYHKRTNHLLSLLPEIQIQERAWTPDTLHIDHGSGKSRGFELMLHKNSGFLTGWLIYELGHTEYKYNLMNRGRSFVADYDRTHVLSWNTQANWKNWLLALSGIWATGTPFSTADHTLFNSPIQHDFEAYINRSLIYKNRIPPYCRFDLKLAHSLKIFSGLSLEYGGTLFNLFNQKNILDQYYADLNDLINQRKNKVTELGVTAFLFFNLNWQP